MTQTADQHVDHRLDEMAEPAAPDRRLHRSPEMRRLAAVQVAVMTTAQVWFVVLTWLLVERSGSGTTVGLVLMAGALPRAGLTLVGGAVTDRIAPTAVVRWAAWLMVGLLTAATVLEHTTGLGVPHLLVLAGLVGAVDAFFFPALSALVPQLVPAHRLEAANAVVQVGDQLTQVVGPAVGGLLLATGGATVALGADAALAALAVVAASALAARVRAGHGVTTSTPSIGVAVRDGLRFARRVPDVRLGLVGAAGLSLVTVGPISVGGTLLAAERYGGPGALGVLLGAFGVGALVGVVVAGTRPPRHSLRHVLVATFASLGVGLAGIGVIPSLWLAALVAAVTAVVSGAAGVVVMTAMQRATPPDLQGRVASLVGVAFLALDPVSQALAGLLVRTGPAVLLVVAGAASIVLAVALLRPQRRSVRPAPAAVSP